MKIFYLTDLLSPYRVEWMNFLGEENEIDAYYFDDCEKTREERWLKSKQINFRTKKIDSIKLLGLRFATKIIRILRRKKYDIYIIDGYGSFVNVQTIFFLCKRKLPVFINVDGIDIWKKDSFLSRIKRLIKINICKSGARFLCGSKIAANMLVEMGADCNKVYTHPFTTLHQADIISWDEKVDSQQQYKEKLKIDAEKMVLAVGRFIPLKKYDVLIKAWKGMPHNCALYLIGGGEERKNYEKIISDNNICNVHILEFMLPEQLNQYYLAADLFVHTSSTETWGLVINEAMAKGNSVISTNQCVAGVELIQDGIEGYTVCVGDINELRERMQEILFDETKRKDMGCAALKRIGFYTYENMVNIHKDIFRQVVR